MTTAVVDKLMGEFTRVDETDAVVDVDSYLPFNCHPTPII
jgi:hypothetical protein